MSDKRYKYTVKVPVCEIYEYTYTILASSDEEAIDKYFNGDTEDESWELTWAKDATEPVISSKEEI